MTKILIFDEIHQNLLNFHLLKNKNGIFGGSIIWNLFIIRSTQFWMVKFGICGKIFDIVCTC